MLTLVIHAGYEGGDISEKIHNLRNFIDFIYIFLLTNE